MTEPKRIITRRTFISVAAPIVPLALGACGWNGGKALQPMFDGVIGFNNTLGEKLQTIRHASADPRQVPAGIMPAYYVSHSLPKLMDTSTWRLEVGGLVRKPASLSQSMLAALPHIGYTVTHHCVEGWAVVKSWNGVPFTALAALVEPLPAAKYVKFESFDDNYMNGWDIESAMHPQTILADAFEGKPLSAEHGAPLRLYSPIKLGYKLTKYLTRVTFTDQKPGGYWEDMGYPWFGGI
jgi:DMSO/TMAO reductase YedYZ molybdopterin-dependent catalytic subunit